MHPLKTVVILSLSLGALGCGGMDPSYNVISDAGIGEIAADEAPDDTARVTPGLTDQGPPDGGQWWPANCHPVYVHGHVRWHCHPHSHHNQVWHGR